VAFSPQSFKQIFSEFLIPTSCYVRNLNSLAPTGFSRMILLHRISVSQSDRQYISFTDYALANNLRTT